MARSFAVPSARSRSSSLPPAPPRAPPPAWRPIGPQVIPAILQPLGFRQCQVHFRFKRGLPCCPSPATQPTLPAITPTRRVVQRLAVVPGRVRVCSAGANLPIRYHRDGGRLAPARAFQVALHIGSKLLQCRSGGSVLLQGLSSRSVQLARISFVSWPLLGAGGRDRRQRLAGIAQRVLGLALLLLIMRRISAYALPSSACESAAAGPSAAHIGALQRVDSRGYPRPGRSSPLLGAHVSACRSWCRTA